MILNAYAFSITRVIILYVLPFKLAQRVSATSFPGLFLQGKSPGYEVAFPGFSVEEWRTLGRFYRERKAPCQEGFLPMNSYASERSRIEREMPGYVLHERRIIIFSVPVSKSST